MPSLLVGGGTFDCAEISGPKKSAQKKSQKKLKFSFFVAVSKTRPVFNFDHFFRLRPPSPLVPRLLLGGTFDRVKERMEAERRKKEDGRRKKGEGRRKKEGRRKEGDGQ